MTCKDCIHCDVCLLCKEINADKAVRMFDFDCPEFRGKADFVEVVRCKDCIHGRKINNVMSPEKYFKEDCVVCECKDTIGDGPMIYPPTHYCSYGERRKDAD